MEIDFEKMGGLVPAIIQDAKTKTVLMLGYMNKEAYEKTTHTGKVTFFSRSRQCLWTKGETSGNFLEAFTKGHADAALAASVFHFGEIPIQELKLYLDEEGVNVRL